FRGSLRLQNLPFGRWEEIQIEPGREVIVGFPRRLVACLVTPYVRLHVQPAVGQLLLVRLQRDQFDSGVVDARDSPAIRADPGRPGFRRHRLALQFRSGPGVPHLRLSSPEWTPAVGDYPRAVRAEPHTNHWHRVTFQVEQWRFGPGLPHLRLTRLIGIVP